MNEVFKMRIADIVVDVIGNPDYLHERYRDFECPENEDAKVKMTFSEGPLPHIPFSFSRKWTKMGIFRIYRKGNTWYQFFPYQKHRGVRLVEISDNFHDVTFYLCDKLDSRFVRDYGRDKYLESMKGILLNLMQEAFFNMILFEDGMSIHSASLIYNDRGIIFSAPSGTGKSTQSNMWHDMYGYEILDGDTTICRNIDGKLMIYGLPWCGTSNLYVNKSIPLDTIVFLSQDKENHIIELNMMQQIQYLYASSFSETWDDEMAQLRTKAVEHILNGAQIVGYACNMEKEAVDTLRNYIDNRLA